MPLRNPVAPEVLRAFETVPDLYLILSADLIILTASDAYLKATLTEREAIVGKPLFEAFPDNPQTPQADGTSNLNASLEQALSTRTPHRMALQRYDVPRPASSGGGFEEKYWSPLNTPVLNGEGEVAYLIHRVEDVTESVKAQAHLKTLREQQTLDQEQIAGQRNLLEALIEQAPVGIGFFEGPRQLVSRANPLICAMWGHAPEAVLNRLLLEGVPELEGQGFDVLIGEVFTTGVPWVGRETPARLLRNGKPETSYYNFVFQPVYDGQGRITGVLDVVTEVTDLVTARRQVQQLNGELVAANGELQAANEEILATNEELTATNEELKATIEELHLAKEALEEINTDLEARVRERTRQVEAAIAEARAQRAELQRIFEQAPVAIATYRGPHLIIESANQAIGRLWGRPVAPLLGRPLFEALPDARGQGFEELFADLFSSGVARSFLETPVTMVQKPGGEPTPGYYNFTYQPLPETPGQPAGLIAVGIDVTGQVLARQEAEALQAELLAAARRQSQEREAFHQIFEQTPALIALLRNPGHRFQYVNPAYQRLFAGRRLVGLDMAEAVPEVREQGFVALLDQVYRTGETYFGNEHRFVVPAHQGHPSREAYFDFTYQAYRENGQTAGISIFAYEVTEQVLASREREAGRQQLQELFMQAPAPIVILDGPGLVFQLVNPAYQQIFPGRALVGKPLLEALPELSGSPIPGILDKVFRTGETFVAQEMPLMLARHADGPLKEIYWTFTYQARRNSQGAVDGVLVFAYEVTDQVLARRRTEEAAAELRLITAHAPAFLYRADAAGNITYVNETLLAWGGLDRARMATLDETWAIVHPEDLPAMQAGFVAAMQAGLPWKSPPCRFRRHDGQLRWMLSRSQPFPGPDGQVAGHNGVTIEIHDQVELQRELTRTNSDLERVNSDLDNFIYTASHDLKAPISNIEGLLQALLRSLSPQSLASERVQAITGMMQASVERFRKTIASLTEIVRLQKENSQPAAQVNLPEVIREVLLDLEPVIGTTGARVDTDVTSCPAVRFSEKNLRSVIYNLVSNAVKYRSPERPPRVRIDCRTTPDCHVLTVTDNGLGMEASQLEKLFTMFKRFHAHVEGSGIGLYMIRKMVENAGGRIQVESRVDEGTVFSVFFPR